MDFNIYSAVAVALGCGMAIASTAGSATTLSPETPTPAMPRPVAEVRCDTRNVVVRTRDLADVGVSCEGAGAAIAFLAAQGLNVEGLITIDLVETLPEVVESSAVGCYLDAEKRAVILAYSELNRRETWFRLPIDRSLYRSLVAHEVAHSIAACNFRVARPVIAAHEYIAYVTTFATMAPTQRELVLAQYPGDGFDDEVEMSTTIYLLDPARFGAEAYRHFLKPANGPKFLYAILAGKALLE